MGKENPKDGSYWAFAFVNGRLAEFHFEINKGKFRMTNGHCYVKRKEYTTKKEREWIGVDTKKYRFTYRNGKYRRVGERTQLPVKYMFTKTSGTRPRKVQLDG